MDPQRQNSPERMVVMGTVGPLRRISPTLLVGGVGQEVRLVGIETGWWVLLKGKAEPSDAL